MAKVKQNPCLTYTPVFLDAIFIPGLETVFSCLKIFRRGLIQMVSHFESTLLFITMKT